MRNRPIVHHTKGIPGAISLALLIGALLSIWLLDFPARHSLAAAEADDPIALFEEFKRLCRQDLSYANWARFREGIERIAESDRSAVLTYVTGSAPARCRTIALTAFASNPPDQGAASVETARALTALFGEPALRGAAMAVVIGIGTAANEVLITALDSEDNDVRYLAYTALMVINRDDLDSFNELEGREPETKLHDLTQGSRFWKLWWDRARQVQHGR